MKEVVEDCSSFSVIIIGDIQDVAFVFHAYALEQEYINCAGIAWVYYTCSYLSGNGRLAAMDHCIHLPFLTSVSRAIHRDFLAFYFQGDI
jgi:hypothetical protein